MAETSIRALTEVGLLGEIHEETSERGTRLVRYPTPQQAQKQATYEAVDIKQVWFNRHVGSAANRSEEHTSELQSLTNLVCRLLLEKKKTKNIKNKKETKLFTKATMTTTI